MDRQ
jgi:hypothetical protein